MPQFRCRRCGREALIPLAYCEDYFASDDREFDDDNMPLTNCPDCEAGREPPSRESQREPVDRVGWHYP